MNESIEKLLVEYEERATRESAVLRDITSEQWSIRMDEFLLPVGRDTGTFLNALVRSLKAQHVLELGTSHGYSTVWLSAGVQETGGRVTTTELSAKKIAYARAALERVGLASLVDFLQGDALKSIATLQQPIDLVLLDLWKDLYIPCFDAVIPKLAPGAILVADNMIFGAPPETVDAYRSHVRANGGFDSVLLPIGSGIEVSRLRS
jgi:predicted O-methyltransferase YrrM